MICTRTGILKPPHHKINHSGIVFITDYDDITDERTEGGIELVGIYFHLKPKIIAGLIYDYSNDNIRNHKVYDSENLFDIADNKGMLKLDTSILID